MTENKRLSYEREALEGEKMPEGLELPDQLMFLILRELYGQFRNGLIDKDTAAKEKLQARQRRDEDIQLIKGYRENYSRLTGMFAEVDAASSVYSTNRTLENADRIYFALYQEKPEELQKLEEKEKYEQQSLFRTIT